MKEIGKISVTYKFAQCRSRKADCGLCDSMKSTSQTELLYILVTSQLANLRSRLIIKMKSAAEGH